MGQPNSNGCDGDGSFVPGMRYRLGSSSDGGRVGDLDEDGNLVRRIFFFQCLLKDYELGHCDSHW